MIPANSQQLLSFNYHHLKRKIYNKRLLTVCCFTIAFDIVKGSIKQPQVVISDNTKQFDFGLLRIFKNAYRYSTVDNDPLIWVVFAINNTFLKT